MNFEVFNFGVLESREKSRPDTNTDFCTDWSPLMQILYSDSQNLRRHNSSYRDLTKRRSFSAGDWRSIKGPSHLRCP